MSQRNSGRERLARDAYETPPWVTDALMCEIAGGTRLPRGARIWEPAAGTGKMVEALRGHGMSVIATDIEPSPALHRLQDFLKCDEVPTGVEAIITNPPYSIADAFARDALRHMQAKRGIVAMLLAVDFDSAKTRADMFADCPAWGMKIVLVDRIVWFDPKPGDKGPSANHAWFVWDWRPPLERTIRYAAAPKEVLADIREKRKGTAPDTTSDAEALLMEMHQ